MMRIAWALALLFTMVAYVSAEVQSAADTQPSSRRTAAALPFSIDGEINDRAIHAHLTAQAGKLIDDPKSGVVEAKTLAGQLKTARQQVEIPAPQDFSKDWETLYARGRKGVVVVAGIFKCNKCAHWHAGAASGFVIRSDGIIVTNYHVMNNSEHRTTVVMTSEGKVYPVKEILAASEADDIAVVKIDAGGLTALPVQPQVNPGAACAIISHPADHFYVFTKGYVARWCVENNARRETSRLQVTADFAKGSSGGPVFNAQGQVIAFVCSTQSIYYNDDARNRPQNFQMVFHSCVPARSLLKLIGGK